MDVKVTGALVGQQRTSGLGQCFVGPGYDPLRADLSDYLSVLYDVPLVGRPDAEVLIGINNYRGPRTYDLHRAPGVDIDQATRQTGDVLSEPYVALAFLGGHPTVTSWRADAGNGSNPKPATGRVVVAPDGLHGNVDADLRNDADAKDARVVHLSASWSCTPRPPHSGLAMNLTLQGAVQGHLSDVTSSYTVGCRPSTEARGVGTLNSKGALEATLSVGAEHVVLSTTVADYHGPGTYPLHYDVASQGQNHSTMVYLIYPLPNTLPEQFNWASVTATANPPTATEGGSMTINPDGVSGSISATLRGGKGGDVAVTATYRCDAQTQVP